MPARLRALLIAMPALYAAGAFADARLDNDMKQLAAKSGCFTCHSIEPGRPGPAGLAPIGPAWRDVAAKYAGQPQAKANLLHTVMEGSNPYASHWKNKVSGLAMPPNAAAISPADAERLVAWILELKK